MQLIVKKRDFINIRSSLIFNSRIQIQIEGRILRYKKITFEQRFVKSLNHIFIDSQALSNFTTQVRLWTCGRGDKSTPSFGIYLNPISTRGGGVDYGHPILMFTPSFESHRP